MVKIGYYEENNYHTEIMGTFIEYFNNLEYEIIVYTNGDSSGYINYYKKYINFTTLPIDNFIVEIDNLDIVVIGTSSSFKFIEQIEDYNLHKIYLVNHLKEDIKSNKYIKFKNWVLTPINEINNSKYILPINNLYFDKEKNNSHVSIGIVGRFKDSNRNTSDIIRLVNCYGHLNFKINIFTRHAKFIPNEILKLQKIYGVSKIIIHYKKSIEQITELMKNINWFCPLTSKKSWYLKDRLTGIIPFGFNYNTPLLLDQSTNNIYNLESPIIYNDSLCEIIEKICSYTPEQYEQIVNNCIEEKNKILEKNKKIFDEILKI